MATTNRKPLYALIAVAVVAIAIGVGVGAILDPSSHPSSTSAVAPDSPAAAPPVAASATVSPATDDKNFLDQVRLNIPSLRGVDDAALIEHAHYECNMLRSGGDPAMVLPADDGGFAGTALGTYCGDQISKMINLDAQRTQNALTGN